MAGQSSAWSASVSIQMEREVRFFWNAVTTNVDGSAVDIDHYVLSCATDGNFEIPEWTLIQRHSECSSRCAIKVRAGAGVGPR